MTRKASGSKRTDGQGQLGLFSLTPLPTRNSNESVASQSALNPAPAGLPPQGGGLLQKNLQVNNLLSTAKEEADDAWDDDFASDISVTKLNRGAAGKKEEQAVEDPDQKTLRPSKSPVVQPKPLPLPEPKTISRSTSRAMAEDYSDMALDSEVGDLETKLAHLKVSSYPYVEISLTHR